MARVLWGDDVGNFTTKAAGLRLTNAPNNLMSQEYMLILGMERERRAS